MLVKYVQHLYDNRKPYWVAKHAVLATQTVYRHYKGHLRPAWESIQTRRLEKPVLSRTPMRPEFLHAICSYGVLLDRKRSLLWWAFIVCLKVGFHGLLRPKELFCLKCSEIRLLVKRGFFESRVRGFDLGSQDKCDGQAPSETHQSRRCPNVVASVRTAPPPRRASLAELPPYLSKHVGRGPPFLEPGKLQVHAQISESPRRHPSA